MSSKLQELKEEMEHADLTALLYDSLPVIPEYIQKRLNQIGGMVPNSDKPMFRIVSGLDPSLKEFAFGEWHRKYISVRDTIKSVSAVTTIAKDTLIRKVHSTQDAIKLGIVDSSGRPTPSGNKRFTILLTTSEELVEYGIPRYIVEKYRSPEEFGSPEDWEAARWMSKDDAANKSGIEVDVLGEYPNEGRYEQFCLIEDGLENEKGEIIRTTYKPLSEAAVEQIGDMILMSRQPSLETFQQIIDKADAASEKKEADFEFALEKGIRENKGRITNMPQIGAGGSFRKQG